VATSNAARVLVFGAGRSGTTWTAQILAATHAAQLANEVDTVATSVYAAKALRGLGHHPVLGADSAGTSEYSRLWDSIVGHRARPLVPGRNRLARWLLRSMTFEELRASVRPDPPSLSIRHRLGRSIAQPPRLDPARPIVAKTVVSVLALDWVLARWRPTPLWVRRHPLDAVAGRVALPFPNDSADVWCELGRAARIPIWCPPPPETDEPVPIAAWFTGLAMSWCRDLARRRGDMIAVDHEVLCRDPEPAFRELAARVGLVWTDDTARALAGTNRPGDGWSTNRITAAQPGRWRTRLSSDEQEIAMRWLSMFPIAEDYAELA
jgi:hypothetical protein